MRLEDGNFGNGRYQGMAVVVTELSLPAPIYDLARRIMLRAVEIGAAQYKRHRCEFAVMFGGLGGRLYTAQSLIAALRRVLIKDHIGKNVALWINKQVVVFGRLIGWSGDHGQRVIIEGRTTFFYNDRRQTTGDIKRIMVRVPKLRALAVPDERLLTA